MSIKKQIVALYEKIYSSDFIMSMLFFLKYHNEKINIMRAKDTIDYILLNECSVARFGEGELELMFYSERNLGFQNHSDELSSKLEKVLQDHDNKLLICVPYALNDIRGRTKHSRLFWFNWCRTNDQRNQTIRLLKNYNLGQNTILGDTQITRPYIAYQSKSRAKYLFQKLKCIWDGKDVMMVEGERTCLGVGNDLFSNTKSIKRVLCPATNAFDVYNTILETVKEIWQGELILLALGPTATLLAADFSKYNIRAIDLGHLDIEYEWYLKGASDHDIVEGKFTNESLGGNQVEECSDEEYLKTIVAHIRC